LDEHQLISSVLDGNKEAFRFLYRLHKDAAWNLAHYICKDEELSKDAVQIAFTSAYTYLHAFRRDASFKTWLLRIVKNESVRICKFEKRYTDIDEGHINTSENLSVPVYEKMESIEQSRWIDSVFDMLNEREAIVLRLFYLEELSVTEVAEVLQFREGNVKVILHRARKQFRTIAEKIVN
jgi:RNA polymerase sigma-70 factor (ECF subfamily)